MLIDAPKAHAKHRPPSAAKRWLGCPVSALVVALYPNEPTDASLKGDYEHSVMESTLLFGSVPKSIEPDLSEAMHDLLEYVLKRLAELGKGTQLVVERQLDIPQTGEFGTCDVGIVGEHVIEVIDYKSGWVPVNVKMNPQLMMYLLGLVHLYGHKRKYIITVHQPTYDHADGKMRSYEVTPADIEWLEKEIAYSVANEDTYAAGKHCKETYCPHRGTCAPFAEYTRDDLAKGWYTSELKGVTDEYLAAALDAAEELAGYRNELRAEAMRRIMNMDRKIEGYKVVKGRKQRAVTDPANLAANVWEHLGPTYYKGLFPDISELMPVGEVKQEHLKFLGTPKQIEDVIKRYAADMGLVRGDWKRIYANVVGPYIRETSSGLTLERAIDGRPAHKRGSEFGSLVPAPSQDIKII
jgi:hypothetical protein